MTNRINGVSLFASAGIGEYFLDRTDINIIVANELIPKRANLYRKIYKNSNMIVGDIRNDIVFNKVLETGIKGHAGFLMASPPCQGISIAGKNRKVMEMSKDDRNYLITYVVKMIHKLDPKWVIIENVPLLLKLKLLVENSLLTVEEILKREFKETYDIDYRIMDTADYGVPQTRKRAIIKMNKKGFKWPWPEKEDKKITVRDVISDLPSLESGEKSSIKWHFGRKHNKAQIEWMRHTPTGHSAFENKVFYPQKKDGTPIKGYNSSYRRIKWDEPAPTVTIRNDAISSQRNVHPGHLMNDGTYSDARVLSILELMRITGLPDDWPIPDGTSELLIRQVLGECVPPKLIESIVKEIVYEN